MICPQCRSELTRRSQRRGFQDRLCSLVGLRPWRCRTCEHRFQAWTVAVAYVFYAHCARCGNLNLERVSRERIAHGTRLLLATMFRVPAYRCDHCRTRFFSIRPSKRIAPTRVGAAETTEAPASAETANAAETARR